MNISFNSSFSIFYSSLESHPTAMKPWPQPPPICLRNPNFDSVDHFGSSVRKWLECCAGIAVNSPKKGGTGKGSEIALLSKADGKRISITGAFPEAQIDGFFFKKLTAQKPCRRFFELMAFFKS